MRYSTLFASLLAVVSASPSGLDRQYQRCYEVEPTEDFRRATDGISEKSSAAAAATINVKTFAHVVTSQAKKGDYPQSQINKQIAVMNAKYKPSNIKFTLASTDFTVNNAWAAAAPQSAEEKAMKNKLHKGTYANLNIYFLSDLGNGLLGYCPFPYNDIMPNDPASAPYIKLDGCLILADSMPGGSATPYNLGITAVHEVGHWFGAYHPFQDNDCSKVGDYVNDTPKQKTATFGCPASKNTCPQPGGDNIHNYMDYSDDNCLNHFTPGQTSRIRAIYNAYRKCGGVC